MPKAKKGRGNINPDSRRHSPRIAISPSIVAMLDAITLVESKSRADVVEELIEQKYKFLTEGNNV